MEPTSLSLIDRLKVAPPEDNEWQRLQGIYLPLIQRWLQRVPGLAAEADDLAQEVFVVVIRELARFERRREGSFRAGCGRSRRTRPGTIASSAAGGRPSRWIRPRDSWSSWSIPRATLAREWDREHDEHVVRKLLAAVKGDFGATTWAAFCRLALDGLPAARVAEELGMPENAVLLAKSRVMRRLRREAGDLLR